jgi:hypothetical protein
MEAEVAALEVMLLTTLANKSHFDVTCLSLSCHQIAEPLSMRMCSPMYPAPTQPATNEDASWIQSPAVGGLRLPSVEAEQAKFGLEDQLRQDG